MKGLQIKEILRERGISMSEVAERLGVPQQNLSAALGRTDIKTGLLEKIAIAIGEPVSFFYGEKGSAVANGKSSVAIAGNGNNTNAAAEKFLEEISEQRKLTATAMDQNGKLLTIIENLSKR